ncbi:MAG: glucokinase [Desulfomonilaceae bacterium]
MSDKTIVLAGDIGGTKTNLGLFAGGGDRPALLVMESYSSTHSAGLSELIARFVEAHSGSISSACFGIAGPVIAGRCKATNLPWEVSEAEIRQNFGWNKVRLVNDLTATAMAIPLLQDPELFTLNDGRAQKGNIGLAAPGTGLGISLLVFANGKGNAVSSEGGHVDFAPKNETEIDLWRYLRLTHDHVSVERVASGPGIFAIYSWLKARERYEEPEWFAEKMKMHDPPAVISEAAMNEKLEPCVKTLKLFVSVLASTAGNLALTGMTTGGMYIGGGIAPRILPFLEEGDFMKAFIDKGRFGELLSKIPVHVILNDKAALLGAARCASEE